MGIFNSKNKRHKKNVIKYTKLVANQKLDTKRNEKNWVCLENYNQNEVLFDDYPESYSNNSSCMEVFVPDKSEKDIETEYNWIIQNTFGDHIENKKVYKYKDDNYSKKVWVPGEMDDFADYNISQRRDTYLNDNVDTHGDYDGYSEEEEENGLKQVFKNKSGINEEQYSDFEHEDFEDNYEDISEEDCNGGYRKFNLLERLQHKGDAHNKKNNRILNIEEMCIYNNENIIKNKDYNWTTFENDVYHNNVDILSDYDSYSEDVEEYSSIHKSEIRDYKWTEMINNKTIHIHSEYDDYSDNEEENSSQLRHYNQSNMKAIEHYDYGDDYEDISDDYEDISDVYEDISDDYEDINDGHEDFSDAYGDISDDYEDIKDDYEDVNDAYENISDDYENMSDDSKNNMTESNGGHNVQTLKQDTNLKLLGDYSNSNFKEKYCSKNKVDKETDFNNAKQIVLNIEIFPRGELLTLTNLEQNNVESILVKTKFADTCRGKNVTFHSIKKIFNQYLLTLYLLKKADLQRNSKITELYLYHGTSQQNADKIIRTNFNHRICKRAFYGQGVYFSPIAFYASRFCGKNVQTKVVLVCRVLVGKACLGTKSTTIPVNGFDSCCDRRGWEIVKFDDDLFYPEYIIECSITS